MTRFAIDRKNRDRKGGHESSSLGGFGRINWPTPGVRKQYKRMGTKLMRRQYNKAINEGLALMSKEQEDRLAMYWDIEDDLDSDSAYHLINQEEDSYEDQDPYGYDDHYDDSHMYDFNVTDDFNHDDHSFAPDEDDWDYRPRSHARLRDEDTTQRLAAEVQRGMVNLELEVIERRDNGKTLGQLLRERLSRPF